VVLLSVVLHGGGIAWFLGRLGSRTGRQGETAGVAAPVAVGETSGPASELAAVPPSRRTADTDIPERITISETLALQSTGEPVVLLDVRTERSYRESAKMAIGALRFPPDDAVRLGRERGLSRDATLVLYCT